jgi:BarA-like signal transduction histidine kinase
MKKLILLTAICVAVALNALESEVITVYMRDQLLKQTPLRIDRNATIKQLKQKLADAIKLPISRFRLVDRTMHDDQTLGSLHIDDQTMIRYETRGMSGFEVVPKFSDL